MPLAPGVPGETGPALETGPAAPRALTQPQESMAKWGAEGKGLQEVAGSPAPHTQVGSVLTPSQQGRN